MKSQLDIISEVNKALVILREPKFRLKDLGLPSRILTHWQQQGILIEGQMAEGRRWRQLNMVDWVWLKIIVELRDIGVSIERIRDLNHWLKIDTVNLKNLVEIKGRMIILDTLEFLILYSLLARIPINILFFPKSSTFQFTIQIPDEFLEKTMEYEPFYTEFIKLERTKLPSYLISHQTHVSVSLTSILKEFITEKNNESLVKSYHLLTDNELELLQYLRKGNLKEVRIIFDDKNEISLLELTELRTNVQKEARLLDYIHDGRYQNITYTTQNDKIVRFENTLKDKLKK